MHNLTLFVNKPQLTHWDTFILLSMKKKLLVQYRHQNSVTDYISNYNMSIQILALVKKFQMTLAIQMWYIELENTSKISRIESSSSLCALCAAIKHIYSYSG